MAQFSNYKKSSEFGGWTNGRIAHRRSAVGIAQIGSSQTDSYHGTVLSHTSDRMELGITQIHAQNQNARPQRYVHKIVFLKQTTIAAHHLDKQRGFNH